MSLAPFVWLICGLQVVRSKNILSVNEVPSLSHFRLIHSQLEELSQTTDSNWNKSTHEVTELVWPLPGVTPPITRYGGVQMTTIRKENRGHLNRLMGGFDQKLWKQDVSFGG